MDGLKFQNPMSSPMVSATISTARDVESSGGGCPGVPLAVAMLCSCSA